MIRVVPGIHSVLEALKTRPESVKELIFRDGPLSAELKDIEKIAKDKKVKITTKSIKHLDQILVSHQGVIAHVTDAPSWPDQKRLSESKKALIVVCDSLEDPHNFGSLVRTAWNLGVTGIIFNKDRSAGFTPASQKVACGGFEHVPVLAVPNIAAEIKTLKEFGFWSYGMDEKGQQLLTDISFSPKVILILGSEETGLRKTTKDVCDEFVAIPSTDTSSSLNVATAGGIAMYEVRRQQKKI